MSTPDPWVKYAAAALAREQASRCDLLAFNVTSRDGTAGYKRGMTVSIATPCTLRLGHQGVHR